MRRYTLFQNVLEKLTILLLLAAVVWIALRYGHLPDEIPTHFDFHGNVDGYGRKSTIWMIYGLTFLLSAGMLLAARLMPVGRSTVNLPWRVPELAWPLLERLNTNLLLWMALEFVPLVALPAILLSYGIGNAIPTMALAAVLVATCVYYTVRMFLVCRSV